jgi:hypothetical protein
MERGPGGEGRPARSERPPADRPPAGPVVASQRRPAIAIPIAVIFRSVFADSNPSDDEETFTRERHGRGVRDPRVRERTDLS